MQRAKIAIELGQMEGHHPNRVIVRSQLGRPEPHAEQIEAPDSGVWPTAEETGSGKPKRIRRSGAVREATEAEESLPEIMAVEIVAAPD